MSATETAAASQYVPYTPFQEGYAFEAEPSSLSLAEDFEAAPALTPFVSEYAGAETRSPAEAELRDLLSELYDQEFDEVLGELADEAWEAVTQRAEPFGEVAAPGSAEQFLQEWSEPVRRAAEDMLDNVAQAVTEHDVISMSEAEVDTLFEGVAPTGTGLEPHFENFLGGLLDKAKSFAKKAISVAKKGISLIPGLGALISKLKALVRPMLNRVLKTAIDKLPATLQPAARQLAQRLLGTGAAEVQAEDFAAAPAAPDVSAVQQQFDLEAASLLFAADESEQEVALTEAANASEREDEATIAQLHDARARFVDELEAGVNPQQALEQFIPAVMAVLPIARTVIGIIGRKRVVDTLAKFLAGFVGGYVPQPAAGQLSQAIVDAGLRLLKLETPVAGESGDSRLAGETIAQTVEDTVRRVTEFDEAIFEEPARLEAAMTEAFHQAAAENFPPQMILPELHEAPLRATWVALPAGRRVKCYKKYTQVFDVEITPQLADSITTFGGTKLAAFLKDQLGVAPPVRAKVHLYQAIPGTTLGRIARYERSAAGGSLPPKGAGRMLHPLTVQAAGMLLGHPKLGRDVPGEFRSSRRRIAVGERFYLLQVPGARPVARRTSRVNVTLDFPKDEFRICIYLSEADAQEIAARIRKQDLTAVLMLAKRVYEPGAKVALGGEIHRRVKILSEALPQEQLFAAPLGRLTDVVRKQLVVAVVDWIGRGLTEYLKAGAGELVAATEDPADGVTIVVRIANPPGAPIVRKLLGGEGLGTGALADVASLFKGEPKLSVRTVAGYRFD